MKKKSLKLNFIMNIFLTGSNYIYPLISFPYVARVLHPSGNGIFNFSNAVVQYFLMLATLGIPTYGIRATAQVRDNRYKLSKVTHELMIISFLMTTFTYILLLVSFIVPRLNQDKSIILISSLTIILNVIGADWLFQGLEEYTYITVRSVAFKILALFLMFIFVKTQNDIGKYAFIWVIGSSGSYVLNFIRMRRYIKFGYSGPYNLKRHFKPILTFFLLSMVWTIYAQLGQVMLGFLSTNSQVGYYTAVNKVQTILISTITALGTVLLPRLSSYIEKGKIKEFYSLIKKDFNFTILASFAVCIFIIFNARAVILILAGNGYDPAIPVLKTVMLSLPIIGISNLLGVSILVPNNKEMITVRASAIGIVVDFIINLFLLPEFKAFGAGISTVIGEALILFLNYYPLRKITKKIFNLKDAIKCVFSALISIAIMLVISNLIKEINNVIIIFLINGIIFFGIYGLILLIVKEEIAVQGFQDIKNLFTKILPNK